MTCEKCGVSLTESNMNVWLTEGMALCIQCERELKAVISVVGNIQYCYNLIRRYNSEKLGNVIDALYNHFENKGFGGFNET